PIANLIAETPFTAYSLNGLLDYDNHGAMQADYPALTDGSTYSILWTGTINIATSGDYTFGTQSDDGSVFYIDTNGDGDWADAGELVVDNNGNHGTVSQTGSINLNVGCYPIAIAFYEDGGGENMEARWAAGNGLAYASLDLIDGSSNIFNHACPPYNRAILNNPATAISATSVVLHAELIAEVAQFGVDVFYGTTDGATNPASWDESRFLGTWTNVASTNLSITVTGLLPNTTYSFGFRASSCVTDLWDAASLSFETLGLPSIDNGGGATNIQTTNATLQGTLTAGSMAEVWIYWGDNDGGTVKANWDHQVNLGTLGEGAFSNIAGNLMYGPCYFYRAYASNAVGEAWAPATTNFVMQPEITFGAEGLIVSQFDTVSGAGLMTPISVLQNTTPTNAVDVQTAYINYGDFAATYAGITANDSFALLYEGTFRPDQGPGVYTFGLNSDDRSVLVIDLNGDGDFDDGAAYDPGELVVDRPCCGTTLSTVTLTDRQYRFAVGYEQGGGGFSLEAKWRAGTWALLTDLNHIDGTSGAFYQNPALSSIALTNIAPTNIGLNSAWLNASFAGSNALLDISVYYGTTDGGTNPAAWDETRPLGTFSNVSLTNLTHLATNLLDNTSYYFAFRANNCGADIWGSSLSFNTPGIPTIINNPGPTNAVNGGVTLQGTFLTGGTGTVLVYWGENDGGTTPANWDNVINLGNLSVGGFSTSLTGLTYGVCYDYRTYVTNAFGDDWAIATDPFESGQPTRPNTTPGIRAAIYNGIFGAGNIAPIANLMALSPNATYAWTGTLNYDDFAAMAVDYPALAAANNFSILWTGGLTIPTSGDYTFGTESDDGSVWYFDLNHDGDFADAGELIVNNNGNHGDVVQTATANLAAGCYAFAIGYYEVGSGETMRARWASGSGVAWAALNTLDAGNSAFSPSCFEPAVGVTNSTATGLAPFSAVLNANLEATGSVFTVTAFYGPTDGGTVAGNWSNSVVVGTFTNVTSTNLSQFVGGLQGDSSYYFTHRIDNCVTSIWATSSLSFQTPLDTNAFNFSMEICFCGYDRATPLTNFPALVVFGTNITNFTYSSFASPNGYDLRFTPTASQSPPGWLTILARC
ncbi:MAG: PA14 domain-containing protein, partial [Verrucomicrobiota bacterium]